MNQRISLFLGLAALLASPVAAETLEAAHLSASSLFAELGALRAPKMPERPFQQQERPFVQPVTLAPVAGSAPKIIKELELAPMLNRHLKTTLQFTLGGAPVWVSGAFNRTQEAYVSVLEQGKAPRFFNVKSLLTDPQILDIGTAKFKLSLSPDVVNPLESEIVLTNAANRKDQQRIMLSEMLDAVAAAGEEIAATGQTYRLFYYDDVSGGTKSLCFILKDAKGELHIFLVPSEMIPTSGKANVFKMFQNKAIGLFLAGAKLQISE